MIIIKIFLLLIIPILIGFICAIISLHPKTPPDTEKGE